MAQERPEARVQMHQKLGERDRPGSGGSAEGPHGGGLLRGARGHPSLDGAHQLPSSHVVVGTGKALFHVRTLGVLERVVGEADCGVYVPSRECQVTSLPKRRGSGSLCLGVSGGCTRLRVQREKPG